MNTKNAKFLELSVATLSSKHKFKDDLIEYQCLCCNKNYQQKFNEKVQQRFLNTYKFSNHDNDVYPYEYMGDWEK